MPTFEFGTPDGKKYRIDGPDAQGALKAFGDFANSQAQAPAKEQFGPAKPTDRENDIGARADNLLDMEGGGAFQAANVARDSMVPFSDEMAAGVGSLRGLANGNGVGEEYQREMEAQALARKRVADLHPVANAVGKTAGFALTAGTAKNLGAGAATVAPEGFAAGTKELGRQTVKGVAIGAGTGAVQGASEGQGWDRFDNALAGAKFGAVVGGALPSALALGGAAVRGAKRAISPVTSPLKNAIMPDDQAAEAVGRAFKRDNISPAQFEADLAARQAIDPSIVAADIGGANTRGLARTAVNIPGEGREKIVSELGDRAAAQGDRVEAAIGATLRDPASFSSVADRLAADQKYGAGPLYKQAYKDPKPVNTSGVIKYIDDKIGTPISGMDTLRPDSVESVLGRLKTTLANAQSQKVGLQKLQQVKEDLDDLIGAAKRAGEDSKTRALMGVKTRLLKSMDAANPVYKQARQTFAGTAEVQDALENGTNIFKMTPADATEALGAMSKSEKEAWKVGVAKAIADKSSAVSDGRDIVKTVFGSPKVRAVLKAGFGDDQAFRKFQAQMVRETMKRKTWDAVQGNSTTTKQMADLMDFSHGVNQDAFSKLLDGKPGQAIGAVVKQVLLGQQGINEKVANKVAEMLLSKDPQMIKGALAVLKAKQVSAERLRQLIGNIAQAGAVGGGIGAPNSQPSGLLAAQ